MAKSIKIEIDVDCENCIHQSLCKDNGCYGKECVSYFPTFATIRRFVERVNAIVADERAKAEATGRICPCCGAERR